MRALLDIGLGNAAVAAGLAVAVALFGRLCKRPALVHSLWLLVLLKLVAPPLVPIPVGWPAPTAAAPAATPQLALVPPENVAAATAGDSYIAELETVANSVFPPPARKASVQAVPAPERPEPAMVEALAPPVYPAWRPILAGIWLAGSLGWLASAAMRIRRFQRALRLAEPAPVWLQTQVEKLADRLGMTRAPEVWMIPGALSPLVWALGGTPRLLVPNELWDRLDDEQRSTLLIHELAHLRRRDHWVRVLELVATGLYWWHPVVWWARRALREAEEQCCDAWVVWAKPSAAKAYATALLETVDFLSQARPALPLATSGIGHVEHLKRRLTMILNGMTPKGLSWAGRLTVLGLAGVLLPLVPTTAAQDPAPKPKKEVEIEVQDVLIPGQPVIVTDVVVEDDDADDDNAKDEKDPTAKPKGGQKRVIRREVLTGPISDDPNEAKADLDKVKADAKAAKADLDKARADLRVAQKKLAEAARRVAELEGKRGRAHYVYRTEDGKVVMEQRFGPGGPGAGGFEFAVPAPPAPPGYPAPGAPPMMMPPGGVMHRMPAGAVRMLPEVPGGNYEKRMQEMEKKLDRLMDEIKGLKKDRDSSSKANDHADQLPASIRAF